METVRKELSEMSFEELQKLKSKIGVTMFNKIYRKHKRKTKKEKKPLAKNQPLEMSSKKQVSTLRHVVPVRKKAHRDPRFDDLSGKYNEDFFKKAYSFIDDYREKELKVLKKKMKRSKNEDKSKNIKYLITRMEQQKLASEQISKSKDLEKTWKKKEKDLVTQGKKQYFLKKSDKKLLQIAQKYRELKEKGKVEAYLKKKRKKTHIKNERFLSQIKTNDD
ncbi:RNA processing 36 homolog [Octopus vulgaris]|uniref:rRNA biogenesis protein RRP36 n=2 Tax=Octopus vulgaris TaxID=6645 RepID=A0AA36FB12_OCTVU|nr:RNA processing 36 homolog [Octopus vulgaris]